MNKILNVNRKIILFACCLVVSLVIVELVLSVRTNSQQLQVANQKEKNGLIEKIEKSADQPLRVLENADSPLRIVETKVKEITGSEFTQLTGITTDLASVSSVPEVKVVNNSGKTITGFILAIRDPKSKTLRTFSPYKVSIAPGETYTVRQDQFVISEKVTVADDKGVRQELMRPKMDSEKFWITFAGRSDFFVTVGMVFFEDKSKWMIQEGGEIQ